MVEEITREFKSTQIIEGREIDKDTSCAEVLSAKVIEIDLGKR